MWPTSAVFEERKTHIASLTALLGFALAAHYLRRNFQASTLQKEERTRNFQANGLEDRVSKLEKQLLQQARELKAEHERELKQLREHVNGQSRDLGDRINSGTKTMNSVHGLLRDCKSDIGRHKTALDDLDASVKTLDTQNKLQLQDSVNSELLELRQKLETMESKFERLKKWTANLFTTHLSRGKKKRKKSSADGYPSGSENGSFYAPSSLMGETPNGSRQPSPSLSTNGRTGRRKPSPGASSLRFPGRPSSSRTTIRGR